MNDFDLDTYADNTMTDYFGDDDFVGVDPDPWFDFDDDNIVDDWDF